MKRDKLGWLAMAASIAVTAQGEWALAAACGYHPIVAGALPVAIDAYAIRALRSGREVLLAVLTMVATNSAAHLLSGGMLKVTPWLVVAVSAIAPLVLWRVHALAPVAEAEAVGSPGDLTPVREGVQSSQPLEDAVYPEDVPAVYPAVPERVRLEFSPLPPRPAVAPEPVRAELAEAERTRAVSAAEGPRTRIEVHAEYVPEDGQDAGTEADGDELTALALALFAEQVGAGKVPPIRDIRAALSIGQPKAQRVQDALRREAGAEVSA
ncbi:MAG: hypothetical protein HOZ81_13485 [Streptomyces sp.]|nr:hypothetical protein [Streptomyces sp.]